MTPLENFLGLVALMAMAFIGVYSLITGSPPSASRPGARRTMIDMVAAGLSGDGPIYELGSAWGALAVGLARRFPERRVIGIEMSPVPYWLSQLFRLVMGPRNLELRRANFHSVDLSSAAAVTVYLGRGPLRLLRRKLSNDLKPGTLIVCNLFPIPGWTPVHEDRARDFFRSRIYVYRMGEGTDRDAPLIG